MERSPWGLTVQGWQWAPLSGHIRPLLSWVSAYLGIKQDVKNASRTIKGLFLYIDLCTYVYTDIYLYAYRCLCAYICTEMSSRVVLGSLFQERTEDYRSQTEAGATPHTCNAPEIYTCPSLSFSPHPLPKPQHAFACKEKYLELFLPLQVQNLMN